MRVDLKKNRLSSPLAETATLHTIHEVLNHLNQKETEQLLLQTLQALKKANKQLHMQSDRIRELETLSTEDELTGLLNRRGFYQALQNACDMAYRYDDQFVIMLLDLDQFKKINDTHGHQAGDQALKLVADVLHTKIRATDYAARLGGDEFAILLHKTDVHQANCRIEILAESLEQAVMSLANGKNIKIMTSLGYTEYQHGDTPVSLFTRADTALYRSKRQRRQKPMRKHPNSSCPPLTCVVANQA